MLIRDPTPEVIADAAERLRRGCVVVFPTETVYGLGASTFDETALGRVYELKGRPGGNPLIAHVLGSQQAAALSARWDDRCERLAGHFWPGPLTIITRRSDSVPARATAAYPTIAVRAPDHPVAQALLRAFGGPISAPSANRSGHVSPTTAQHVADDYADVDDLLVLDGGPCRVGIESTVLDLANAPPRILRPGSVAAEAIEQVLGEKLALAESSRQAESPGTSPAHYAPRAPAVMIDASELAIALRDAGGPSAVLAIEIPHVPPPHTLIRMSPQDDRYAADLYDALRRADAMSPRRILIERPPRTTSTWRAIHDRLARATAGPRP